jgi:hypothetical protein
VDPERIGALGLSTGADVLLEVVAERDDIAALVTDGAAAGSIAATGLLTAASATRRASARERVPGRSAAWNLRT